MSQRTVVNIPKYLRQQVDELIEHGVAGTLNSAVHMGLNMLVNEYRLRRWDDTIFSDYKAGFLSMDPSGALISRVCNKDLTRLSQDFSEIRRLVRVIFFELYKPHFGQLNVVETKIKDLYIVQFTVKTARLQLIFRKQGKQIIACRVGYTTEQL